ncbi:hypothetical protein Tco_1179461 [Tanacetum coccineum]
MFHNLDLLRLQLEREILLEVNPRTCLEALRTQFKEYFASKGVNSSDHLNQCWQQDFKEYMLCEPNTYIHDILENLDTLEAVFPWKPRVQNMERQDTSSSSGNYITHAVDADIRPVNDHVPFVEIKEFECSATAKATLICNLKNQIKSVKEARWIPTGKMFIDSTTKVDSEPPNGSNEDITNPYECVQTLNVSAVQALLFNDKMTSVHISSSLALQRHMASVDNTSGPAAQRKESSVLVLQPPSPTPNVPPTKNDWDSLFYPMFDEYFNPSPSVVQHVLVAVV